jgi:hypothetical protein
MYMQAINPRSFLNIALLVGSQLQLRRRQNGDVLEGNPQVGVDVIETAGTTTSAATSTNPPTPRMTAKKDEML